MKAYPLIYSRTQKADFVPDFLVRPADLDYQKALNYVKNAMTNLDISNVIRYCTFSVGTYHICGGISCISKQLVATLGSSFDNVAEYLADEKGRKIGCFIGFAIPDKEAKPGIIPDITLADYWDYYLEYLKHQWKSVATKSEILTSPIDLNEKPYIAKNIPSTKSIAGKNIIQNFSEENRQAILENYFDRILNRKEDVSFLSDVSSKNKWDELVFTDVSVSDNLYRCLTSSSHSTITTHEDNIGSALPEWSVPTYEKKNGSGRQFPKAWSYGSNFDNSGNSRFRCPNPSCEENLIKQLEMYCSGEWTNDKKECICYTVSKSEFRYLYNEIVSNLSSIINQSDSNSKIQMITCDLEKHQIRIFVKKGPNVNGQSFCSLSKPYRGF